MKKLTAALILSLVFPIAAFAQSPGILERIEGKIDKLDELIKKGTVTPPPVDPPPPPPPASPGVNTVIPVTLAGDEVTVPFSVPVDGVCTVWPRVLAPTFDKDSFLVSVDGGADDVFDAGENIWSPVYQWTRLNGRGGGVPLTLNPRVFNLAAGNHSIRFRVREAGVGINAIFVSCDGSVPPGAAIPDPIKPPPPVDPPPPPPLPIDNPPVEPVPVGMFASPAGTDTSAGTIDDPLSLKAVFAIPGKIPAGTTVWLRNGEYPWYADATLTCQEKARCVVRSYPGEKAVVLGHIWAKTSWVDLRDFRIRGNDPKRTSTYVQSWTPPDLKLGGIDLQEVGEGTRLIDLIIHDGNNNGIGVWGELVRGTEISGCIVFNNGWFAPDRPHGHGLYIQNWPKNPIVPIDGCIFFNNFVYGVQSYGSGDVTNRLTFSGNIFGKSGTAGNQPGLFLGAGLPATDIVLEDTYSWTRADIGDLWGSKGNQNVLLNRNIFFSVNFNYWQSITGTANRLYDAIGDIVIPSTPTKLDRTTNIVGVPSPSNVPPEVFVRPNKYTPGRAHIAVYNWPMRDTTKNPPVVSYAPSVQANLSSVLKVGQRYEIMDAMNILGAPVVTGVYDGKPVTLPMTGLTVGAGFGIAAQAHTAPGFAAFVVEGK